jgi:hypothetical protein
MKTAVEWLVQGLHDNGYFHEGVPEDIVKKAKEMEKEQIINAYNTSFILRDKPYSTAEKYYTETFKSEE